MKRGISFVFSVTSIALLGLILMGHIQTTRAEFEDVSISVGLDRQRTKAFGNPTWVDFNNDGHLDMVSNRHGRDPNVYLNTGEGSFINIFSASGLYPVAIGTITVLPGEIMTMTATSIFLWQKGIVQIRLID